MGGYGNDIIYGGTGNDTIVAGSGNDSILGGSGDDIIYGGTGDSTISGGTGNSTISGGGGNDVLIGGGFDSWLMFYGSTNMTLTDTTFSTSGGSLPASASTDQRLRARDPGGRHRATSRSTPRLLGGGAMLHRAAPATTR